jgi:hypothetical protein
MDHAHPEGRRIPQSPGGHVWTVLGRSRHPARMRRDARERAALIQGGPASRT